MANLINLKVPYAILPSLEQTKVDFFDDDDDDGPESVHRSILNLGDCKRYEWKNMLNGIVGSWCVGSSHGFLVLLDKETMPLEDEESIMPLLLEPSSSTRINFPPLPRAFIDPLITHNANLFLRKIFIVKAVVMVCSSSSSHILVIIYGCQCKIAYCKGGMWFDLSDAKHSYSDIVVRQSCLYALTEDGYVEGWDLFQQNPKKILFVRPSMEIDAEAKCFLGDKFSTQLYLVISGGKFFMVIRYIGNFVNQYGEVVEEGDLLSPEDTQPLICPYRTMHFSVFKLDHITCMWKKVRSLHDQVLFLGANESVSVPAKDFASCEANSIYFTDDRWFEMNLDYMYGGHDFGIFSMKDASVQLLLPYANKIDPPPIWVVPSSL